MKTGDRVLRWQVRENEELGEAQGKGVRQGEL